MIASNAEMKLGKRRFSPGIQAELILILLTLLIPTLLIQVSFTMTGSRAAGRKSSANLEIARSLAKTFDATLQDILHQELSVGFALASKDLSQG